MERLEGVPKSQMMALVTSDCKKEGGEVTFRSKFPLKKWLGGENSEVMNCPIALDYLLASEYAWTACDERQKMQLRNLLSRQISELSSGCLIKTRFRWTCSSFASQMYLYAAAIGCIYFLNLVHELQDASSSQISKSNAEPQISKEFRTVKMTRNLGQQ